MGAITDFVTSAILFSAIGDALATVEHFNYVNEIDNYYNSVKFY